MRDHNLAAIHDRIDEEHFEGHLHAQAIQALQQRVIVLEASVRELLHAAFNDGDHLGISDHVSGVHERAPRTGRGNGRRPAVCQV